MRSAVIVDIVRTGSGRGKSGGALSGVHPVDLLAQTIKQLLQRTDIDPALIDDVIVGCAAQAADQAVNIARNAALVAGIPASVPGTTVDRQCGSSQQAAHFAAQGIMAGAYDVVLVGGVESMSRVPMGTNSRGGDPWAPLAARYPGGLVNQGVSAELIAARWNISRDELDEFSARSHVRAAIAQTAGAFDRELIEIAVKDAQGAVTIHASDQTVRADTTTSALAKLQPAFTEAAIEQRFPEIDWRITPGNSSPLTDGASAALIMSEKMAESLGLAPRARFHSFTVVGSDPLMMLTGIIPATERILARAKLDIADIGVFEVNEAFASVPLAWTREFDVDQTRLNPHGGAIALGHALGASGIRLMATMVNRMESNGERFGLQVMCEGGGMANATILERV